MKKILLLALLFSATHSIAQIKHDFMVGGSIDIIKSDFDGLFSKAQIGTEVNYFLDRKFTATGGLEAWTSDKISAVIGGRWYPTDALFVRARGLIGVNDLAIGAGWNKSITENLRFEAMADFYFHVDIGLRAGVAYVFRRKVN